LEAGVPVRVVVATDGAHGQGDAPALCERREWESRRAAAILGYGEPQFRRCGDQQLAYGEPLVERIAAELDDVDLVYAPSVFEINPTIARPGWPAWKPCVARAATA
jgi:LmbE family N-acetylglucosaminyl deacetylase